MSPIEVDLTTTELPADTFGSQIVLVNSFASFLALMGAIGNYLSFRSAECLPEATSKYLMKYLAVFDSLAALGISLVRQAISNFVIPSMQVSQHTDCFSSQGRHAVTSEGSLSSKYSSRKVGIHAKSECVA